jgi:two-component system, response regulator, stage 0 sporulation protein F
MASILIVDDDKAVSLIMKLLLERDGHCITCAGDGPTALQVFREAEFELLILDIFMPGMDGLETMRQVHQLRPGVPIIVISGHAFSSRFTSSPDFLGMSIKLGAVCSLQKPFKSAVLLSQVARCLQPDHLPPVSAAIASTVSSHH